MSTRNPAARPVAGNQVILPLFATNYRDLIYFLLGLQVTRAEISVSEQLLQFPDIRQGLRENSERIQDGYLAAILTE
jgi:hypothetical protein